MGKNRKAPAETLFQNHAKAAAAIMEVLRMWGILLALISGILMSVQGVFNTEATRQTSLWLVSAFVHLTAFLVCAAAWMAIERTPVGNLWHIRPWYLLLGGVIGAFITITVVKAMSGLGPAKAAMLIVTAQVIAAYLIELFGLFGVTKADFSWRKLLGAAIAIGGIILFKWEK